MHRIALVQAFQRYQADADGAVGADTLGRFAVSPINPLMSAIMERVHAGSCPRRLSAEDWANQLKDITAAMDDDIVRTSTGKLLTAMVDRGMLGAPLKERMELVAAVKDLALLPHELLPFIGAACRDMCYGANEMVARVGSQIAGLHVVWKGRADMKGDGGKHFKLERGAFFGYEHLLGLGGPSE